MKKLLLVMMLMFTLLLGEDEQNIQNGIYKCTIIALIDQNTEKVIHQYITLNEKERSFTVTKTDNSILLDKFTILKNNKYEIPTYSTKDESTKFIVSGIGAHNLFFVGLLLLENRKDYVKLVCLKYK